MNNKFAPIQLGMLAVALVLISCSLGAPAPTATPVPTNTPLPPASTPTDTPVPTATFTPTATPDVEATQKAEAFLSMLASFKDEGYINSTEGTAISLDTFKQDWAQLGWYKWWPEDGEYADFVFVSHVKWQTAAATNDLSGCGIVFGLQANNDHYAVFLDKNRIFFAMSRGSHVYSVGKTKGPGRVSYGNPAEADFVVIVKGQSAFVSADGVFTTYTLSQDQTSAGKFALTVLSGTNRDYGTRCQMTNMTLWTPK